MWNFDEHDLLRRKAALESGVSERDLASAIADGRLVRVSDGTYIDGGRLTGLPRYRQNQLKYRSACVAAATRRGRSHLLSHESAAAVLGLATLEPDRERVHFTNRKRDGGSVKGRSTAVHAGHVADEDIVVVDGVRATNLARTAVDIALHSDFKRALAVLDAALKKGVEREELEQRLKAPRSGAVRARYALQHANKLSDNPGESWCRAQMIEAGLPTPVLQQRYDLFDGTYAKVDFDFGGLVVVEFDGLVKYGADFLKPGETAADVVIREKRREDGLRELGLDVIRILYEDLRQSRMVPVILRHLKARGIV